MDLNAKERFWLKELQERFSDDTFSKGDLQKKLFVAAKALTEVIKWPIFDDYHYQVHGIENNVRVIARTALQAIITYERGE